MNKRFKILLLTLFSLQAIVVCQRSMVGFYLGPSIGYNAVFNSPASYSGILDFNFDSFKENGNFFNAIRELNDGDMSNNEFFNGSEFGIYANLPIVNGFSIQPEIQYQVLDFNHILIQQGTSIFNDLSSSISGYLSDGDSKIAIYSWKVNYINFPFILKIYPTNNLNIQIGAKFGFLVKAEELSVRATFNSDNEYTQYSNQGDRVVYEFFESNSSTDNHGFDKDEWPFNFQVSLIGGIGYETKSFYLSIRYNLGLIDFFKELKDRDGDFFDNYNTEFDSSIYSDFEINDPIINNNFQINSISFLIGFHLSS